MANSGSYCREKMSLTAAERKWSREGCLFQAAPGVLGLLETPYCQDGLSQVLRSWGASSQHCSLRCFCATALGFKGSLTTYVPPELDTPHLLLLCSINSLLPNRGQSSPRCRRLFSLWGHRSRGLRRTHSGAFSVCLQISAEQHLLPQKRPRIMQHHMANRKDRHLLPSCPLHLVMQFRLHRKGFPGHTRSITSPVFCATNSFFM